MMKGDSAGPRGAGTRLCMLLARPRARLRRRRRRYRDTGRARLQPYAGDAQDSSPALPSRCAQFGSANT
jgi:hypothetical protein